MIINPFAGSGGEAMPWMTNGLLDHSIGLPPP
jgi:hypothetical protein